MSKSEHLDIMLFRHFSLRLSERYGVLITFQKYQELCAYPYLQKSKIRKTANRKPCIEGFVKIEGIKVRVIRDINHKKFLTALPK